ncbi:MAG: sugar ABC transporter permease [Planctomycetes bacterium]|nr:sugar ABC transporter permease [Planctomycetota bacterium]
MMRRPSAALWFLSPWLAGFVALSLVPMGASFVMSLMDTHGTLAIERWTWEGDGQYREALGISRALPLPNDDDGRRRAGVHDDAGSPGGRTGVYAKPRFLTALWNSLLFTLFAVPLGLSASLGVALLMNRSIPGISVFRAIVYLPYLLGGVATILIWSWLFNPRFGWINWMIRFAYDMIDPFVAPFNTVGTAHWPVPDWLYSETACIPALVIMDAWTMGGAMIIFLAALKCLPKTLYDAAVLDGAGAWRCFRHVTIPMLTPAILFNLIVAVIFAMQSFKEAYLLQHRSQHDGLLFVALHIYETAFEPPYRLGHASAIAWLLVAVLIALVVPILISSRWWVHYEDR